MSTGSVSDPEEMELRGLQRVCPIPTSKRPPVHGAERGGYASPSDNSSAEEDDPDGDEERGAGGDAGGGKRKRPRAVGGGGAGGEAGGGCGGKKPLPPRGSAAEGKQSQRNAANARERARMRVLSKAFSRLKTSLPWVPPDTKLSKLDTLRLASSYIAHLRQLLQEDRYENGYVHPVNLVGMLRARSGRGSQERGHSWSRDDLTQIPKTFPRPTDCVELPLRRGWNSLDGITLNARGKESQLRRLPGLQEDPPGFWTPGPASMTGGGRGCHGAPVSTAARICRQKEPCFGFRARTRSNLGPWSSSEPGMKTFPSWSRSVLYLVAGRCTAQAFH